LKKKPSKKKNKQRGHASVKKPGEKKNLGKGADGPHGGKRARRRGVL